MLFSSVTKVRSNIFFLYFFQTRSHDRLRKFLRLFDRLFNDFLVHEHSRINEQSKEAEQLNIVFRFAFSKRIERQN